MNFDPELSGPPHDLVVLQRANEDLRLYQAELEVQNEELISAKAATESALARYSALFHTLPMPALVLDRQGLVRDANRSAVSHFGFKSVESMNHHSVYRLLAARDDARLKQALSEAAEGAPRVVKDLGLRTAERGNQPSDAHVIALPVEYHLDHHHLILLVDRSVERSGERERLIFQSVLDNSNALIYAFDREGRCILANQALLEGVGKPRKSVVGQRREYWLPVEDAGAHARNDRMVLLGNRAVTYEETLNPPDAPKRHFISHKFPLRDGRGKVFGVAGITTDITETRQLELRLQLAMQVLSRGSEGIIITDHNNCIISVNKAFEAITGYGEAEVLGKNPSVLSSGRQNDSFYAQLWDDLLTKGRWEGELWNRRKDGVVYPQWASISRIAGDTEESSNFVSVFSDVTHRKMAEEEIERLAFYDILTGSPNRYLLRDRVDQAIRVGTRERVHFALCFLDLDHFKEVNDVYGHDAGDEVLIEVTKRLKQVLRAQDTVSRLGGDEFVVLLTNMEQPGVQQCVQKMLSSLAAPYTAAGITLHLSASLGVAMFPDDGRNYQDLLKSADTAMYQAKASGRNGFSFFSPEMAQKAERRVTIEAALRDAIANGELRVVYQPKVSLATGSVIGTEALLRWQSPLLGAVSPDVFISIAEECGLITPIGSWVLAQALAQTSAWAQAGLGWLPVSVNVSSAQFWKQDFPAVVERLLKESGVQPAVLELELTERLALKHPDQGVDIMRRLKGLGVCLSIDDFGTGYSSLSYLSRLPVDTLKIDQSFVAALGQDPASEVIVRSIVQLAHTLSIDTVAEGVEQPLHLQYLRDYGCDSAQGYYFARPLEAAALPEWLRERPASASA